MSKTRKEHKGQWKKGESGNPGGVIAGVRDRARKMTPRVLDRLIMIVEAEPKQVEVKLPDGTVQVELIEAAKDSDRISAAKEILKIAGAYPAEEQKITVEQETTQSVPTEELVRAALDEVKKSREELKN